MAVLIKEILNKMIEENAQMPRILWEFKISNAWGKINSAGVAQNSTPDKLIGGVLYVNAKNSAWAQQINLLKPDIMLKLNAFMGEQAVKEIRLRTGLVGAPSSAVREKPKNCVECKVEFSAMRRFVRPASESRTTKRTSRSCGWWNKTPRSVFMPRKVLLPGHRR